MPIASANRSRKPKPLKDPAGVDEDAGSSVRTVRDSAASTIESWKERLRGKGVSKTCDMT